MPPLDALTWMLQAAGQALSETEIRDAKLLFFVRAEQGVGKNDLDIGRGSCLFSRQLLRCFGVEEWLDIDLCDDRTGAIIGTLRILAALQRPDNIPVPIESIPEAALLKVAVSQLKSDFGQIEVKRLSCKVMNVSVKKAIHQQVRNCFTSFLQPISLSAEGGDRLVYRRLGLDDPSH
jgi:hypothetical protein